MYGLQIQLLVTVFLVFVQRKFPAVEKLSHEWKKLFVNNNFL